MVLSPEIHEVGRRPNICRPTVICFSHLRWKFVYQRPQHLLSRCQARADVFFFEEPLRTDGAIPYLAEQTQANGVQVLVPMLPEGLAESAAIAARRALLDKFVDERGIRNFIAWYYTPMALLFSGHLRPAVTVYDCMDELSAFRGAPSEMLEQERQLFDRADVVFAGGRSLYEVKREQHENVHLFPSSIDYQHFSIARMTPPDPRDQREIPHPRIGFFGVLDERLDCELLQHIAAKHREWHFVLVGPVVKIRQEDLPVAQNIHYLGKKEYDELPAYVGNWDVTMLPFARNASTRFISPTKTPEYLAAGKPVVSTPIVDVVDPYGELGFARIAENADEFCAAINAALMEPDSCWLTSVDNFLRQTSWDLTFSKMWNEVIRCDATASESTECARIHNGRELTNV